MVTRATAATTRPTTDDGPETVASVADSSGSPTSTPVGTSPLSDLDRDDAT